MVIPERTRRVHKIVVPFFAVKLAAVLFSLAMLAIFVIGIDYIHVLGSMVENKRLKGENFKLRQELQLIQNKVDSMQWTIERVRNYAKKLQLLTGQGNPGEGDGGGDEGDRSPASTPRMERHTRLSIPLDRDSLLPPLPAYASLGDQMDRLQKVGLNTEESLSMLQTYLMARRAIMRATPSLMPISGWITSPFGWREHPILGEARMHAGVDIAAEPGTPVRAPADGLVVFSGEKEGYGKVIVIDHGYGISTLFAHNSKLFANVGLHVKRGQMISQVGSTGMSTGPHLHYEVRKNGMPVNPTAFFHGRF